MSSYDSKDIQLFETEFTNKIDFTKGFSSFHRIWPVDNSFFTGKVHSPNFETPIKKGNETLVFKWYLGIEKEENGSVWFGIFPVKLPVVLMSVGVVFRLALCDGSKMPFFNELRYRVFFDPFDSGFGVRISLEKMASVVGENLVLHVWMEIPNDTKSDLITAAKNGNFCEVDFLASSFRLMGGNDLSMDFSKLFNNVLKEGSTDTDVALIVVDKESKVLRQFNCHRFILTARSPVFEKMLGSMQWKEGAGKDRSVEIKDIGVSTMEYLLRYIYTGYPLPKDDDKKELLDGKELWALMNAAEKYMLPGLKNFCTGRLICYAYSDEDRLEQFLVADQYQLAQLKAVSFAALVTNPEGVKSGDGIPQDMLIKFYVEAVTNRNYQLNHIRVVGED